MTVNSSEKLRFLFILVGCQLVPHSGSPVNTSFNSFSNDHTWESLKEGTCGRYQAGSAQWVREAQLQVPGELGQ